MIKPENISVITPRAYIKVEFRCSNRAFYDVKNDLYNIARSMFDKPEDFDDFEPSQYMSESCDYEGDLNEITIYNNSDNKFFDLVADAYNIDKSLIVDGKDVVFTL